MQSFGPEKGSCCRVICPGCKVLERCQKKTTSAACRIRNPHRDLRSHNLYDCTDHRPRGEILTGPSTYIICIFCQQTFIHFTFYVLVEGRPVLTVYHLNEKAKFGRIGNLALWLRENEPC